MRTRISMLTLCIPLVIAACSGAGQGIPSTSVTSSVGSSAPTSTLPPVVDCPGAGEFGEGSGIAEVDGEGSDSNNLGRINWESTDQCESFQFEFETSEGAPATTVPGIRVSHLETFQVIRVEMDVGAAVVTDQLVETGLVDRLFVVRALDGGLFVDIHLRAPAAARARVDSSPARLTIDLRPGLVQFSAESVVGERVVVVTPGGATDVSPTTEFAGYVRGFASDVHVVTSESGVVVAETTTAPAPSETTWGEFTESVVLPTGEISVLFGEPGQSEGTYDGVTVELFVS